MYVSRFVFVKFLLFLSIISIAQTPNVLYSNGYIFTKQWTNDFTGDQSGWHVAEWTFDGNLCEFGNQGLAIQDNELSLTIQPKLSSDLGNYPNKPYWGSEYWQNTKYLYGRFEVELQPNTPSGVVTSFFLMNITWNNDYTKPLSWAEIDIEFAGKNDAVQFTIHWIDQLGNKLMNANTVPLTKIVTDKFHIWTIEWTPTYISYYLDDDLLFSFTDPNLLATQKFPQEIHLNHWVSPSVEWVGAFDESKMPVVTKYRKITYYRFDGEITNSSKIPSIPSPQIIYEKSLNEIQLKNHLSYKDLFVYNINGELVLQSLINRNTFSTKHLKNGMYVVVLSDKNRYVTNKIIIDNE